jgi:hypothetical protein
MKLDIGCGDFLKEGYIGVDKYPGQKVKIVCDISGGKKISNS